MCCASLALVCCIWTVGADPIPSPSIVTNSLGMKLVLIPVTKDKATITIEKPFYLGATEVTTGEFRSFVKATHYRTDCEKDGYGGFGWNGKSAFKRGPLYNWTHMGDGDEDEKPVVNVTWRDAVAFCKWLSEKESIQYRLPTEAEWEYACAAGSTKVYSFGDDQEELAKFGNVADRSMAAKLPPEDAALQPHYSIMADDGYIFRAPVGKFRPNAWGLFDMHGNVWEWCADRMDLRDEPKSRTVRRGGSWRDGQEMTHTKSRLAGDPLTYANDMTGFRVAREP